MARAARVLPAISMTLSARVTDPSSLTDIEREQFVDELYAVQCDVFDGVERQAFQRYVVDSSARKTEIKSFHDDSGDVVGYMAIHLFDRVVDGVESVVIRAEAGMKRAHRGASSSTSFMARHAFRQLLTDRRPTWYMGSLVHPSSFMALTRHVSVFWPHPERETPPNIEQAMIELGESFGLEPVDPARPLVRKVGWRTRDSAAERAYWAGCTKRLAHFFVEQNPGYVDGHGLITLIPYDRTTVTRGFSNWSARKVSRSLRRMTSLFRASGRERLSLDDAAVLLASTSTLR